MAIGISGLIFDQLSAKLPSACLVVAGVVALYIALFDHRKTEHEKTGRELIRLYNELRDLYRSVQAGSDLTAGRAALKRIDLLPAVPE